MRTLTNDYRDFTFLNLEIHSTGRGPFVIRQDGIPPSSEGLQTDRYLLHKDGTWVINFKVFSLSEEEQSNFIYDSVSQIQTTLQSLSGALNVDAELPSGKTHAELMKDLDSTYSRFQEQIQKARAIRNLI